MDFRIPAALALVLLAGLGGCTCAPATPTPVRLVVRNPGDVPIHVDVSDGRLGVELQRYTANGWLPFVEWPACECQSCELICGGCDCSAASRTPLVMKVAEGAELQRTWPGVVQVEGAASCGLIQGPACLYGENAPATERFRARFCYAENVPALRFEDAGVPVLGVLPPEGITCVEEEFRPEQGEVVLGPRPGAQCAAHADCDGEGELCLGGRCSAACPANGFPVLGASWRLAVDEPEDQGFFAVSQDGEGVTWEGVGTVGAVRYDSGILQLSLLRPGPSGGTLPGRVRVVLPVGHSVPFTLGETVAVWVRELTSAEGTPARGIVIRDSDGRLLLAADAAEGRPVLTPDRTAPFAVNVDGDVVGCTPTDCGRELQQATRFAPVDGGTLAPGASERVEVGGRGYRFLNVANARYERTTCRLQRFAPYAVLATRDEQAP